MVSGWRQKVAASIKKQEKTRKKTKKKQEKTRKNKKKQEKSSKIIIDQENSGVRNQARIIKKIQEYRVIKTNQIQE